MFEELWFDCWLSPYYLLSFQGAQKSTRLLFSNINSKKRQASPITTISITGQLTHGKKIYRIVFRSLCEQKSKILLLTFFFFIQLRILTYGLDGTQTSMMHTSMQKQIIHPSFTRHQYLISTAEYLLPVTGRHIFLPFSSTIVKHGLHLILLMQM